MRVLKNRYPPMNILQFYNMQSALFFKVYDGVRGFLLYNRKRICKGAYRSVG